MSDDNIIGSPKEKLPLELTSIRAAKLEERKSSGTTEDTKIKATWEGWKKRFLIHLPKGILVKDPQQHRAFAEGSGYGMMIGVTLYGLEIAAILNDQKTFDGILQGLENYAKNKNGLYAWLLSTSGEQIKQISATDADLYVAYCLIKAHELVKNRKWKIPEGKGKDYYAQKAQELINNIWKHEVITRGDRLILKPSDDRWPEWGDGRVVFNPSYFAPYQLKVMAKFDQNKSHDWKKLIDDGYTLMFHILEVSEKLKPKGQNPIPDNVLCRVKGDTFLCESYNQVTPDNEYDAIRVPLEIGRDAIYNKDPRAIKFLKEFLKKAKVEGFWTVHIGAGQNPDNKYGWNNEFAMAMYGVAVKGAGDPQNQLAGFKNQLLITFHKDYFGYVPQDADQYYKQSLVLQAAIILFSK